MHYLRCIPSFTTDTELRPFPDVPEIRARAIFNERNTVREKTLFFSEIMGVQLLMPGWKEQAKNLAIK